LIRAPTDEPVDGNAEVIRVEPEDLLATSQAGPAAIRGGALRVGSFLAGSLFSVAAAALLFRHLGVIGAGRYTTAMSLAAIVTGFTDLGLTAIGIRELSVLGGDRRATFARNLLGMRLALTAVGVSIVSVLAFAAYGTTLGLGVLIAGCGVLIQNTQTTLAVPLMARLRLGWVSALDLARQVSMAALIALFVVLGAHLLAFLALSAAAAAIVLPPTVALVRGDIPLRPSFDPRVWRSLLGPVLTYSAAVAAATLYFRVAIVLVSLISGSHSHQLGYFSLSYRVVEVLFLLPGLLVGSAFPIFARAAHNDPARLGFAIGRVFEVSLIVGVWVSLSLAIGASLVIELVGGPSFHPAVPVLAVQGLAVGATFVGAVWGYGLLSLHLHRAILILNLTMLAATTVTVAVLTTLDGAQGAAIGTASVEIVAAIVGAVVLTHGRPHLRPKLHALPKVAAAALLGASPALLTGVPVIGRIALSTLLYAATLLALRALPADLLEILSFARRQRP
jgi:O-antigen/teichoic acid export membrane protein